MIQANPAKVTASNFSRVGAPIVGVCFLALLYLETRQALRERKLPRKQRLPTNGLIPAMLASGRAAQQSRQGVMHWVSLPQVLSWPLGFLLLDYGNYLWHRLTHRLDWLWRFHQVHHSDLDLDVTTALRFHLGEILLSVLFRAAVIRLVGAPARLVLLHETLFEAATNFHHSNWRLSPELEQALNRWLVTPRMHGIHHSIIRQETDSNFCVIFNAGDRLHATLCLDVAQQEIDNGLPAFRNNSDLQAAALLMMPFRTLRPWMLPDGAVPKRKRPMPDGQ